MATTLPRGIQLTTWKTAEGKQVRYRVRIVRKTFQADKLFDTLEEAKEFLSLSKSKLGTHKLNLMTEDQKLIKMLLTKPALDHYIKEYLEAFFPALEGQSELEARRVRNTKAFYKILASTEIEIHDEDVHQGVFASILPKDTKRLGSLRPHEITSYEVASYIKARLKAGIKPISIERELTYLSVLFKKIPLFDPSLKDLKNPALQYDKDLLKSTDKQKIELYKKREFRLSTEDEKKLMDVLEKHKNPEMKQIVLLALYTAMRRSEILTLTWEQVKETYIQLYITKSGRPRKVFLTKEAKELLKTIPKIDEKVFHYKIQGFEGSFIKLLKDNRLSHIRFHDFRRESISRFVEKFGPNSSVFLTEALGIQNVAKFEELHGNRTVKLDDEEDLKRNVGHSSKQLTKLYSNLRTD